LKNSPEISHSVPNIYLTIPYYVVSQHLVFSSCFSRSAAAAEPHAISNLTDIVYIKTQDRSNKKSIKKKISFPWGSMGFKTDPL
ncbi:MAG: hypothetical protein ACI4DK_02035, partial [Lachnospiraceae bacterium]